jgi:hypothetical protein
MSSPDTDNLQPIITIDNFLLEPPSTEIEAQTSASSFTANTLSSKSFSVQGGTLKRNMYGKNEVWEFFQVYNEKKFKTHACCLPCKSDFNYGKTHSTSNLDKHIMRHHKKEYEIIMSDRANKRLKLCDDSSIIGAQAKLTTYSDSSNIEFQECFLNWMFNSYQHNAFRKMIHYLNKKAPVIVEDKIKSLMSMKYFDTIQAITKIRKGKNVTLTTNAWTSIAKEGYVTLSR